MAIAAKNSSALQWLCPLMRPSEATMETAFEEVTEEQREEPRKCFHVKVSIWFTDIYSTDVLDVSKANVVLVPTDVGGEALFEEFRWHFSGEKQRRRLERFRASSQSGSLIALCSPSKTHTVNTKMLTHTQTEFPRAKWQTNWPPDSATFDSCFYLGAISISYSWRPFDKQHGFIPISGI